MIIFLNISSKNIFSLTKFIKFLKKVKKFSFFFSKQKRKKTKKFIYTLLKSPHVNKIAQEQFELKIFKRTITFYTHKPLLFFFVIKQIKKFVFFGINFKIKIYSYNNFKNSFTKLINPNNFRLKLKKKLNKKVKIYLKILDVFGEILLKEIL